MENQINTWTTIHLHNALWQMLFYFSAHERPWIKWPDRSEWVNNLTIQFVRMGVANDWVTDGRVRQCILSSRSTIWPGEPKTFIATSSNSCLLTPFTQLEPVAWRGSSTLNKWSTTTSGNYSVIHWTEWVLPGFWGNILGCFPLLAGKSHLPSPSSTHHTFIPMTAVNQPKQ